MVLSLNSSDEHLFSYLPSVSALEKCLFISLETRLFGFLLLDF